MTRHAGQNSCASSSRNSFRDALNMPAADRRAAYALEHIAFRVGKIEESLAKIAAAIEALLAKA